MCLHPLVFVGCSLPSLMALAERNQAPLERGLRGATLALWLNRAYHRLRANSRWGSRRNIAFHYDLGNAFYGHWLDEGIVDLTEGTGPWISDEDFGREGDYSWGSVRDQVVRLAPATDRGRPARAGG